MTRPVRRLLPPTGPLLLALCLLAPRVRAQEPAPAEPPRNLLVRVQTALERVPLGYSVVAAPALGIERFTGANGTVVIPVPRPGPVRLVIKRLGFTPRDTVVTVTEAVSQSVTIALARVSFRLEAVRVVAWPPCRRPGIPRNAPGELRGIVDQLRQNAERYRLLTRTYPFIYTMEREFGQRAPDGTYVADSVDLIRVSGTPEWSYRPGRLVEQEKGTRQLVMRIPSISDLADDTFVDNHCFHVAGLEEKEGQQLLRLDILAAARLRSVDADVVVWLDPKDYQLRHATFTLTKTPPQVLGLLFATSKVRYVELIPFVPVMELMVAENTVQRGRFQLETRTFVERQTIRELLYRGLRPDALMADSLPRPDPDR